MITKLKAELENVFPEYEFDIKKRIYGKCIVIEKSKYCGAEIIFKKDILVVQSAIPKMKTRLLIGAGAVLLMLFKKNYHEPSKRVFQYLKNQDLKVKYRN